MEIKFLVFGLLVLFAAFGCIESRRSSGSRGSRRKFPGAGGTRKPPVKIGPANNPGLPNPNRPFNPPPKNPRYNPTGKYKPTLRPKYFPQPAHNPPAFPASRTNYPLGAGGLFPPIDLNFYGPNPISTEAFPSIPTHYPTQQSNTGGPGKKVFGVPGRTGYQTMMHSGSKDRKIQLYQFFIGFMVKMIIYDFYFH